MEGMQEIKSKNTHVINHEGCVVDYLIVSPDNISHFCLASLETYSDHCVRCRAFFIAQTQEKMQEECEKPFQHLARPLTWN